MNGKPPYGFEIVLKVKDRAGLYGSRMCAFSGFQIGEKAVKISNWFDFDNTGRIMEETGFKDLVGHEIGRALGNMRKMIEGGV